MIKSLRKNTDRLITNWNKILLTVIALFTFAHVDAQFYPVQTTTQLIPPYSVYLSDYATGGNEKLRVILLQRDLTQPSYQLRLVMTVELNGQVIMRTSRSYNPAPINLNPGIPTVISGAELAPYVDSRNIDFVGYSRDQYERTKALPEGSYQITFTAYDYRRQDVQVSNAGISFYYLSKNEPPLINFPACGTKVPMRTPQQIVFSWLSRNTASPNSAADTEFELSLYETRPEGRNPNDVVLSTQPVFRITVDLPQYIYSPSDPLLLNGMKYVWRVRAIDRNGKDAFRNNGYSEVCTFTYGGSDPDFDMGVVKNLQAEGETERKGRIWWDLGDYDGYVANYRKTGEGYEWFTSTITKEELTQAGKTQGEVKLFDLEPDTEYETRVQPKKSGFLGAYTEIIKFRTKPHVVAQCGVNPNLPQADLTRPMRSGIKGMLIQVDDIEIQLMDVLHLGDGWYKGTGRTSIPYFGGAVFAVTFDRLYIDENRVAGLGRIDFVTQGVAGLVEQQNANLVITKKDLVQKENREEWKDVIFFENIFVYDDIVITNVTADASGEISIVDNSGNATPNDAIKEILKTNPDKAIIIQDKNGDQYVVQKDGANTKVTKVEGGGLAPGADGKMLDEKTIKNLYKMILISLNKYKTAINQYLVATNPPKGKGGGDRIINWNLIKYLADLPVCLEEHKDQLGLISTRLITLVDSAQIASREFATRITPLIKVVTQENVDAVTCQALVETQVTTDELNCNPLAVSSVLRGIADRAKQCDNDVDDDLEDISESDLKQLCVDQRIDLIKCLDNFPSQGSDDELLIKLLQSTPVNHRVKLLSRLQDEKIYQDRLIEAVDGEEFIELVNTVSKWLGKPTQTDWENAVIANRFLFFDGDDAFTADFVGTSMKFATRKNFSIKWYQELIVKPNEFVAVTFTNDFVIAGNEFHAGEQVTMSGLAVWSLFNEMFNKRMRATGAVALDIPLLFVGIGEINAVKNAVAVGRAIRALRYAKAGADIIIATGGLVMAVGLEDELSLTEDGRQALKYWTWFNLIYAGGTLTPQAISSAKGLYSSGKNLLLNRNLSSSARVAIEKWMETLKEVFKKQGQNIDDLTDLLIDFSKLDIPSAMKHIKFRDFKVLRGKGIGGCHDASEWAKINKVDELGYSIPKGKNLSEVPEVIVSKITPHGKIPGVSIVEYKIPILDRTLKTTGELKGDGVDNFVKTIYDPAIWPDAKLEQALMEAVQDAFSKNAGVLTREWEGLTKEGFSMRGFYENGKITSFFFK